MVACEGTNVVLTTNSGYDYYLWSDSSSNNTLSVSTSGTYSVTIKNGECVSSDSINIIFDQELVVDLGDDFDACNGHTVVLDAGLAADYHWSTGDTTQIIQVMESGNYKVTITNSTCRGEGSVYISYRSNPTVDLGVDVVSCNGATHIIDPGEYESYIWSNDSTTQSIAVQVAGDYSVTVANRFGCTDSDTINVDFADNISVDLGSITTACDGTTIVLDAGAADDYTWNDASTGRTLDVTTSGTYSVDVNVGQCAATGTIDITVYDNPTPNLGENITACDNIVTTLDAGSYESYLWSYQAQTTQTIDILQSGIYRVTVTDANNCEGADNLVVTLIPAPDVNLGEDFSMYTGQTIVIGTVIGNYTYSWNYNDSIFTTPNILASGSNLGIGTHEVSVFVVNQSNNCQNSDTVNITVGHGAGVDNINSLSSIKIFPNPTNGIINFEINSIAKLSMEIVNLSGQTIYKNTELDNNFKMLDLSEYSKGIYFVKISDNVEVKIQKIIIE